MVPPDELVHDFSQELRRSFSGDILLDRFSRVLYSTDASIYQIEPLGVLIPRSHDDLAATVAIAARHGIPLLSRGGGTSLAGQTVGAAMVIDYSKYMNRILDINLEEHKARVEPGVILDHLNQRLGGTGLQFGPDVSTSNRATLGGMAGNNSCGSHSILHGKTNDHVREMRVLLSGGIECRFSDLRPDAWKRKAGQNTLEGRLYRSLERIIEENRGEILVHFPKIMRRVGGYNLDRLVDEHSINLCNLMVGAEGTLGIFSELVVNLAPAPRRKAVDVVHFDNLVAALETMEEILPFQPAAIEFVDRMILDLTRRQPAFARKMTFIEGDPDALLLVEFYGDTDEELKSKISSLDQKLKSRGLAKVFYHALNAQDQANLWAIRKAGLGLLSSIRGDEKAVAFVEDTAVPPESLGKYVSRFQKVLERHNAQACFYGHASVGCLHLRPLINLKNAAGVQKMVEISRAVKDLVIEFKGAMSAEHGDGLSRSHYNRELFGARLYEAFRSVKAAFDPAGIMNPGKIVDAPPMTADLRLGPGHSVREITTYFDFSKEGGLGGATEQCSGIGECRKTDTGTMCPSYMATRDEEHTTRGRATALHAALSGRLPLDDFAHPRLYHALDLCLACKACKTECPANVDMAKLKSEFLAHYNVRNGASLRSRVFANFGLLSRLGSATAPLSNRLMKSVAVRRVLQGILQVHPNRSFPVFARESFKKWLKKHPQRIGNGSRESVVLFNDTYTNYNEPDIGRAALKLLESTGSRVFIPDVVCCGRPMISKGFLDQAKENAIKNVARLAPFVESGAYIVGLEPSCLAALRDEYPDLVRSEASRKLADRSLLLEEYLALQLESGRWKPSFKDICRTVLLHGHCHQKSLVGTGSAVKLLRLPPGYTVTEIESGCCGMAGAFGYEKEHYAISIQIAEMKLLPAIRAAAPDAEIVADGISCRQQIHHGTGRKARHFAEVLAQALADNQL